MGSNQHLENSLGPKIVLHFDLKMKVVRIKEPEGLLSKGADAMNTVSIAEDKNTKLKNKRMKGKQTQLLKECNAQKKPKSKPVQRSLRSLRKRDEPVSQLKTQMRKESHATVSLAKNNKNSKPKIISTKVVKQKQKVSEKQKRRSPRKSIMMDLPDRSS